MKKIFKSMLPIVLLFIAWGIVSQYTNSLFLPKPSQVLNTTIEFYKNGMLMEAIIRSGIRVIFSTILACLVSIPLGLLMFSFEWIDDFLSPIITMFRYFPGNAFYPLLILWIGINDKMKITFLFLVTFVYFLPTIVLCVKEVDNRLVETGYTMGMNKAQVILKIVLPYCAPSICKNIVMMLGMGWTYIPLAEMANAVNGLGHMINIGGARGRTDIVFCAIFIIIIISWITNLIANSLIEKSFKWKFKKSDVE